MKLKIISVLFFSSSLFCMEQSAHNTLSFSDINTHEEYKNNYFFDQTITKKPLELLVEENKKDLLLIKSNVHVKEEKALSQLQKEFPLKDCSAKVTKLLWQKCYAAIEFAKAINKGKMTQQSWQEDYEDDLNSDIITYVKHQLNKKGINSTAIVLRHCSVHKTKKGIIDDFVVRSPIPCITFGSRDGVVVDKDHIMPGYIILYPSLLALSVDQQKALCDGIIYNFYKQNSTKRHIVLSFLMHYADYSRDTIIKSASWQALIDAYATQATIIPCCKNRKRINAVKQLFLGGYYEESSVQKNIFRVLCAVDSLFKQGKWLNATVKKNQKILRFNCRDFDLWRESNNNPVIILIDSCEGNLFNILKNKSFDGFSLQSVDGLYNAEKISEMFYCFFEAIKNNKAIYEFVNGTSGISLRALTYGERTIEGLEEMYGKEAMAKAHALANSYYLQKNKEL